MGITHKDFFRLLPNAMGKNEYRIDGRAVLAKLAVGTLTIIVGEEQERVLSPLVKMPFANVTFEFHNVPYAVRADFEQYFELRFMRGLG